MKFLNKRSINTIRNWSNKTISETKVMKWKNVPNGYEYSEMAKQALENIINETEKFMQFMILIQKEQEK